MSAFDLLHDHIARQLAPKPRQPAVAQATPLASADDIREAIEVLEVQAFECELFARRGSRRARQLRNVVTLLRANLHRAEG
jgi:hypothetical protein